MTTSAAAAKAAGVQMPAEPRPRLKLADETLDAISERARSARPGRALLALIGGLLFAAGWLAAKAFRVLFFSGAWAWAAMAVGWRQARGEPPRGPSAEQLLAENDALRKELARITPAMS